MTSKKVSSVKQVIDEFLLKNRNTAIISEKQGYRTQTITGKELARKINKTRQLLHQNKIHVGDAIIILGKPSINWIAAYCACIQSRVTIVPLDTLTDKTLLMKIRKQVHAKALFQDKKLATVNIKKFYLDELDAVLEKTPVQHHATVRAHQHDILEIQYTSGTTGEPNGVVLTHENIVAGINSLIPTVPLKIKLKFLNMLPLSHIFGQIPGLFLPMYFSYHLFLLDTIQTSKIITFIKNKKINAAIVVPGILTALKNNLERKSVAFNLGMQFRLFGVGGAPLTTELEKWWKQQGIFVVQGYGLTETAAALAANKLFCTKTGSVGKILFGVSVTFGADDEILVKGNNVAPCYYKNEQKTNDAFEDGWFKTGDVGFLEGKFLYLKERKKEVIITGAGLKAYPVDIETILNKINGVRDSCVIERNGKIHATLLLEKHREPIHLIQQANNKLLGHQKIAEYSVWPAPDFPRTPIGKIKKYVVREQIAIPARERHYDDMLYSAVHRVLQPRQKITSDKILVDLGMDSLKRVQLVSELEQIFHIELSETDFTQHTKVADIELAIKKKQVHKISFKTWPLNPFVRGIGFILARLISYPIIRFFTSTKYIGLEHVAHVKTPVIFACNHQSAWDGAAVAKKLHKPTAIAAEATYVFGYGTKSMFSRMYKRFTSFLATMAHNIYPFGEGIGINTSLEYTGELLDRGYSVIIFPEAQRTLNGEVRQFKEGSGYLATTMNVPIIPVRVKGFFEILPVRTIIPRFGKSTVIFGESIPPESFKKMSYQEATRFIEQKVRAL